ncbi:MAG: hypothetical protein AABM33_04135 [Pseudomonadota bacterium]
MNWLLCVSLVASLSACAPFALHAPDTDLELRSAIETAHQARIDGPAEVRIAGRMVLRLQPGLTYIPPAQGERLLRSIGERPRQGMLGVVIANVTDSTEMVVVYATVHVISGIPELELVGWKQAPAFAGFRQR